MDDGQDLDFKEQFSLFCKYQQAVHNDPVEKLTFERVSVWFEMLSWKFYSVNRLEQCSHTQNQAILLRVLHLSTNYF